ncbi:hypothetical protein BV22DRAFT_1028722 [Leucogyrophana mollusca]|uniref:Uncharacterized protein n=1 Tax=Leucogyrophana mollusca TaxID=85980 RepID=A0ACB8BWY8_9AGAM|nr:hypothetical protein BV22DRAFT_1028722 [Leucogyrophana mollusca]
MPTPVIVTSPSYLHVVSYTQSRRIMCNFVVPVRICSKCHHKEPLYDKEDVRDWEPEEDADQVPTYIDPEQDCYSRWCVYSSEHPNYCSRCWLTCKHWHGKTREIHGGTLSYLCRACAPRRARTTLLTRNSFSVMPSGGRPPAITTFTLTR